MSLLVRGSLVVLVGAVALSSGYPYVVNGVAAAEPPGGPSGASSNPILFAQAELTPMGQDSEHYLRTSDRRKRRYLVHLPPSYDAGRPWPVVLAFHGGGGRAETMVRQSGLNEVADKYGFVVVYPEGSGWLKMLTFNAGVCCGYAVTHQIDDVAFVRELLDELPRHWSVDLRRVYATGMSNGAMLCYRLAAELSERITAIAPVAGDRQVDAPQPVRPVPVIHFHGRQDPNVLFDGGIGPNQFEKSPRRSVAESLAFWIRANGCQPDPVVVDRTADFQLERWEPPAGQPGAPVVLYQLLAGGHTWPGGVDVTARMGTGPLVANVSASTLMWQFFEQFALPEGSRGGRPGL